ncbi:MAG: hypothetical protein ACE5LF_03235, partial [Alphaproteobacteria bacterium]
NAQPVTLNGVTFSDELGGFTIVGASGTGTLEDPFVVVEEITGPGAAVLVIRGFSPEFGNRVGTYHPAGFALKKIVTNRTPFAWSFVDFELQQNLGLSSDTLDGLSFGQGANSGRPFRSDRFVRVAEINEPVDYISFHEGVLKPGETATFDVIVTDTTPVALFYLVQRPNRPVARAAGGGAPRAGVPPW